MTARLKTSFANFKQYRYGFTIIEVTLVLGITGLMLMGLVINVHHNIADQRYATSVQDFNSFLRQVYNQVENTQIADRGIISTSTSADYRCVIDGDLQVTVGPAGHTVNKYGSKTGLANSGRTNCSVYGKLVTFGEAGQDAINVYDVLGDVVDARNTLVSTDEKNAMREVHLGIIAQRDSGRIVSHYPYTLSWGASIEAETKGTRFTGELLIVRSPLSGIVHTYYRSLSSFDILNNYATSTPDAARITANINNFNQQEVNFCVRSDDLTASQKRRNVRLSLDAHNASDIIMIDKDNTSENKCV